MKKLMILILVIMLGIITQAQEPENIVIIEQPTNVRSAPRIGSYSLRYIVRAVVSQTQIPVTGRNFDGNQICTGIRQYDNRLWLQVSVRGVEGWIKFCENDFVGDLTTVPVTEPLNPETRLCANTNRLLDQLGDIPSVNHVIAQTLQYRINVRERPDITAERIEWLTSDDVYVIGRSSDDTWVKVTYNALVATCSYRNYWERQQFTGWVASFLLDLPDNWQDQIPVVES